jgi:dextranase
MMKRVRDRQKLDIFPLYSQFRPGQPVQVMVELPPQCDNDDSIEVTVFHHHQPVTTVTRTVAELQRSGGIVDLAIHVNGGYHACAFLYTKQGTFAARTAFDVRSHWREAPRYGFLCNFDPATSHTEIQDFFRKYHLNVVQFYDWMERHDALVPRSPEFVDPMGRRLCTEGIHSRIRALKEIQAASMGYAAVYASLVDYAEAHPEQGLYDNLGKQYSLIDIFYLMDISSGSTWREHILSEFAKVAEFGFDGLHLDQYGFPKAPKRRDGSTVRMDEAYPSFIDACREKLGPDVGLIFNNVSSYPVHSTANTQQDAVYVEVWPPMVRYRHLSDLITRIRLDVRGQKQVILAAYLKPFRQQRDAHPDAVAKSALLVSATIFASGAYHLILGESYGMLTEPYYPDYVPMVPELVAPLRAMYDIVTADGALLSGPDVVDVSWSFVGGINDDVVITGAPISVEPEAGKIWVRVTSTNLGLVIHLVNMLWLTSDEWNFIHDEPFQPAPPLDVTVEWNHPVESVWVQRAESPGWYKADTEWRPHSRGEAIHVTLAPFDVWSMIFVPYTDEVQSDFG